MHLSANILLTLPQRVAKDRNDLQVPHGFEPENFQLSIRKQLRCIKFATKNQINKYNGAEPPAFLHSLCLAK